MQRDLREDLRGTVLSPRARPCSCRSSRRATPCPSSRRRRAATLGTGWYCAGDFGCAPNPTLTIETSEGPGCVDLAIDHSSGTPATNVIITGRPNATSTQVNRHASCGGAEMNDEVRVLDATGRVEDPLYVGTAGCSNSVYGRWDVHVEVDGEESNAVEVVYYNSGCAGITTCAMASSHCP